MIEFFRWQYDANKFVDYDGCAVDFPRVETIMEYVPGDESDADTDDATAKESISHEPRLKEPQQAGRSIVLPIKDPNDEKKGGSSSPKPNVPERRSAPSPKGYYPN